MLAGSTRSRGWEEGPYTPVPYPGATQSLQTAARTVLTRVVTLGALYLLQGDTTAAAQAVQELMNVATTYTSTMYPTWSTTNPTDGAATRTRCRR